MAWDWQSCETLTKSEGAMLSISVLWVCVCPHQSAHTSNESISRIKRYFLSLCSSTCLLPRYLSYLSGVVKVGWSFVIHGESSLTSPVSGNDHPSDNSFQTLLTWIWFESQIKGLAWNLFSSLFFLVSVSVDIICIPFILGITLSVD